MSMLIRQPSARGAPYCSVPVKVQLRGPNLVPRVFMILEKTPGTKHSGTKHSRISKNNKYYFQTTFFVQFQTNLLGSQLCLSSYVSYV